MKKAVTTVLLLSVLLFGFTTCGGGFVDPGAMEYVTGSGTGGTGAGGGGYSGYGGGSYGGYDGGGYGGYDGGGYGGGGGGSSSFPGTSGSLTITGLSAYNGKWVFAGGEIGNGFLIACDGGNDRTETLILTKISGGSATLKVWKVTDADDIGTIAGYNGNDRNVELAIIVWNRGSISALSIDGLDYSILSYYAAVGDGTATFSGGRATVQAQNLMDIQSLLGGR